ncbi:MAG: response regulator [Verrucomicrobiota bacterium]|nr:response regulator [Verrucomicrobiota bacterium]
MIKPDANPIMQGALNAYPRNTALFAGLVSSVLGFAVVVGWSAKIEWLLQLQPQWAPMQYNTALCFIMAGVALLSQLTGRTRLAQLFSSVLTALALLTCVQYVYGWDTGLDTVFVDPFVATLTSHPGRMSPITGFCFILVGAGLFIGNSRRIRSTFPLFMALLSCVTMAFCLTAIFGYITGLSSAHGWGQLTHIALNTSLGLFTVGLAVFTHAWELEILRTKRIPQWLPIPVVIASMAATLAISNSLQVNHELETKRMVEANAHAVINAISLNIKLRLDAMQRMARRWTFAGHPSRDAWEDDARTYYKDFAGIQAIEWIDSAYIIRWAEPLESNANFLNLNPSKEARRRSSMELARANNCVTMTRPVNLLQGGKGFLVYCPLKRGDDFDGFIAGVFNNQVLLDAILYENIAPGYAVAIYDGDEKIYERSSSSLTEPTNSKLLQETVLDMYSTTWRVQTWPTPELLAKHASPFPLATLLAGMISTGLLGAGVHFSLKSRTKARELAETNQRLQLEITQRERVDAKLREINILQNAILNSADFSIISTTVDGTIQSYNAGAEKLLGYNALEMVGNATPELIHCREEVVQRAKVLTNELGYTVSPGFETFVAKARTGITDEQEWTYVRKDGSTVQVLLSITPLKDSIGELCGFLTIGVDITERIRQREELAHARDAALASARLKSEFLANMSHEIRTPMNGVIGMINLLLNTSLTPQQRSQAETVRSSAEALLSLLNDILDLSKIEAGKMHFEHHDFDLRQVVEGCVEILSGQAHAKGLEIAAILYRDVPSGLQGDAGRLRQVITNLLGNAVKFTEQGEVVVRVKPVRITDAEATLRFSITDTGIGISPEAKKRLFQVFSQADGSITRKYGGTGLGLAISKQLVGQMHGEIGVNSEAGKGSEFWFTATFQRQVATALPAPTLRTKLTLEGMRLLIADENKTNCELLLQQLNGWGMQVKLASSGHEALTLMHEAAAEYAPYNLAIIEITLSDIDGLTLADQIKKQPALAGTDLILMLAQGRQLDNELIHSHGYAGTLYKPIKQSILLSCLQCVINGMAQSPEVPTLPTTVAVNKSKELKILLAEDYEVNQRVAIGMLEQLGHTADVVANGEAAVERFKQVHYDLILMDCHMPILDGHQATIQIRALEHSGSYARAAPIPIIAMTADAMVGDKERCLASGMNDYISKPVRQAELTAVLLRVTQTRPTTTSNAVVTPGDSSESIDTESGNSVVDWNYLRDITQYRPEDMGAFISFILKQLNDDIPELELVLKQGTAKTIAERAHKLYGSCAQTGMIRMALILRKIEHHYQDANPTNADSLLIELEAAFQATIELLESRTKQRKRNKVDPLTWRTKNG